MSKLLSAAHAFRAALRSFDPALLSGEACALLVSELAVVEKACAAARVRAAARAAACHAHEARGFRDAHEWLARESGTTASEARSQLDTALLVEACPATREALAGGQVSFAQAKEIAKLPDAEVELLAFAKAGPLHQLRDEVRSRRLNAMDVADLHCRQRRAREFRHWRDDLGMIRLAGALPPEVGVAFVNRLDAETDRAWRAAHQAGHELEARQAYAADAFVQMLASGGKSKHRSADVVVVVDSRKLADGGQADGPCHLIGGGPVPVQVVREIAEDAFVKVVLHDGVDIHKVAHVGRYQPAELRTALLLGPPPRFDGVQCVEPGCGRHHNLECDHVDPVANGGPTTLWNLQWRCKPHHRQKTERDLQTIQAARAGPCPDG